MNFIKQIFRDFLNGFLLCVLFVVKCDVVLLKFFILISLPFWCIVEDFLNLLKRAFVKFMFFRSLYILSHRKYGRDYIINYWFYIYYCFFRKIEDLNMIVSERYLKKKNLMNIKAFYIKLKHYEEMLVPQFSFIIPLFLLRLLLIPFYTSYLWFVIPNKKDRQFFKKTSYLYMFFHTFIDGDVFKDENMHPKFKTSFPFVYLALSELVTEVAEIAEHENAYEDYIFIESLSLRKRCAFVVIIFSRAL